MPLPPVRSNVPKHVLAQPPAGGAQGPAIAPNPLEGNPPVQAPRMPTDELVAKLDSLLVRAGKAAGQAVDEAALAKLAKGAKFDKATADALRATAKAANEAMRTLDAFTGADFANAMVCDQKTKTVSWDERQYVGKAVRDALDKQQQLSNTLSKLLNDLPAKATAEQQATLEEAMLQCDRRIGEVETVILELTEIAEKGLFGIDDKTRARLDRKVTELAGEKALEMHDRSLALQTFQEQLAPVVERLNHYAAHSEETVPKNDLLGFRRAIGEAKNAISTAAKNGFVRIPKSDGGMRELFVDRSFLDEAAKLLGEAEAKLGKLRENAARDLRRKFVLKDAALPSVELLQPKFAARLRELGTTPEQKRQTAAVADFVLALDKFRKAMLAYADNPSGSNKSKVLNALDDFRDDDRNKDWKAGLDFLLGANRSVQAENDPELHAALDAFKAVFSFNKAMKTLVRKLENLVWNTEVMTDHLEALNLRAKSSDQFGGADAVRAVFFGEGSFTTLIESRVHGYAAGDIDPALDDRNVANYMVQVKPDLTVVVKAIDNDGSFGATRIGLTKFRLPPEMARLYMNQVRNLYVRDFDTWK